MTKDYLLNWKTGFLALLLFLGGSFFYESRTYYYHGGKIDHQRGHGFTWLAPGTDNPWKYEDTSECKRVVSHRVSCFGLCYYYSERLLP